MDDESIVSVDKIQDLALRTVEIFKELLGRGDDAFQLEMALERDWFSARRPSKQRRAAYLEETQRIRSLAKDYSRWLKENPDLGAGYINRIHTQLRSGSAEDKVAFLMKLQEDRTDRLERQLPEFKNIVDSIDSSVQRLRAIVFQESG